MVQIFFAPLLRDPLEKERALIIFGQKQRDMHVQRLYVAAQHMEIVRSHIVRLGSSLAGFIFFLTRRMLKMLSFVA